MAAALPLATSDVSEMIRLGGAVTITTLFTHGLAVRTGGRPFMSGALALLLSAVGLWRLFVCLSLAGTSFLDGRYTAFGEAVAGTGRWWPPAPS